MEEMLGRLLTLLLLVGVTAGCHDTRGSEALLARVKLHENQGANCVVLEVLTPEGTALHSERVPRPPGKQELRIALFREQLPEEVTLQARPLWSPSCDTPTQQDLPNGPVSEQVRARFLQKGGSAELLLGPPEHDTDTDGFADGAKGGPDCMDTRSDTNPAAAEVCDAIEDRDCDALRGCNDPTCAPPDCIPVPSRIAFTQWKDEANIGACTGPFSVARQDDQARESPIAEELTVTLQGTSADFYSDSRCETPPRSSLLLGKGAGRAPFYLRGRALGPLNVIASTSRLGIASGSLQVVTGPAATLVFTTPERSEPVEGCSEPLTLERRDAQGNIVTKDPDLDITFVVSPLVQGEQLQFFSDASCQTSVTAVRIPQGQSSVSFHYKGTKAGRFTLTAFSQLPSTEQDLSLTAGMPGSVKFTLSSQTVLAGACSGLVEVGARDKYDNPALSSAQVSLSSTLPVTFYSNATCQTALPSTTTNLAEGRLQVYFKGTTLGTTTFTADVQSLGVVQQEHTVRAAVTTGQCQLSATDPGAAQVTCPISPALIDKNRTFLVFQATSAGDAPGNALVRCHLSSTSSIVCDRRVEGPAVDIQWQTAEFAPVSGVQVRHLLTEGCTGNLTSLPLDPPVQKMDETFVLHSFSQDGFAVDGNDAFTVKLATTSRVDIANEGGCGSLPKWALQVVEFPGAKVDRGTTTMSNGSDTANVSGLPTNVDQNRSVVLYSFRAPTGDAFICNRLLRGELTGNNTLRFNRGQGSGSCDDAPLAEIAWERIQFPANYSVQETNVGISYGQASGTVGVNTVDPTRTIVFSGGQSFSGQGGGETNFSTADIVGAGVGRHRLTSATQLEVVRGHPANSSATFTSYVLQLARP
jgi:hypothetical protein